MVDIPPLRLPEPTNVEDEKSRSYLHSLIRALGRLIGDLSSLLITVSPVNPTDKFMPINDEGVFADSPISIDDINNLLTSAIALLAPREITEVSSTYTILLTDDLVRATANTFTITLPTAVGIAGTSFDIKNAGVGVVTLDGDGVELIDGQLTQTLGTQDSVQVTSFGTGWDMLIS